MSPRSVVLLLLMAVPVSTLAAERPEVIALNQRLATLQGDPQLGEFASYEKLRAQQSVAALAKARSRDREAAQMLADRRVEIAETTARAESARRQAQRLDRTRSELLLEASRREATRARQEVERLRVQTQIQAEEAGRMRLAAETELLARQDVEDTLTTVTGQQTQRLTAARQKEAQLARQEAELMSGTKLPASRFNDRGEVFSLGSAAFESGQAQLSSSGTSSAAALAAYLQANPKSKAIVQGYGDKQTPGQRRADALRDALVEAGVARNRLQSVAKGDGTQSRAVEVIVSQ